MCSVVQQSHRCVCTFELSVSTEHPASPVARGDGREVLAVAVGPEKPTVCLREGEADDTHTTVELVRSNKR